MSIRRSARPLLVTLTLAFATPAGAAPPAPAGESQPPAAGEGWRWTPEVIVDITRLSSAQISPEGSRIVYVATRPRAADAPRGAAWSDLWVVPFAGGAPRRLTTADAEDKSPAWSPDGRFIAFLSARGAEKAKTRLWVMPADGGEPRPLSGEKSDVESFAWSRDARSIAYVSIDPKSEAKEKDEKEGRDWQVVDQDLRPRRLWVVQADGDAGGTAAAEGTGAAPAPRPVDALGDRSVWEFGWGPDARTIVAAVSDTPRTDDSYMAKRILILPVDPGARSRQLVGNVGKIGQLYWSLDGARIAWRGGVDGTDPSAGSLFVAEVAGGAPRNLTGDREESVGDIVWLQGDTVIASMVQGTRTALVAIDVRDPASRRVLVAPGPHAFGEVSASRDGRRFAFAASTAGGPAEVYAASAEAAGRRRSPPPAPRRLTDAHPRLATLPRGRQETFAWKATDGLPVEGVLIHPAGDRHRESHPLVVIVHGGPESQYLDGWNTGYNAPGQALAERGCYVFYPNYRGSTGRGVAYSKANHRDLGGREFLDILDGIDALKARFRIDPKRVGITGGSYGGYFTGLAVMRWSDRFAAGVALFGISDWLSFLGQSDIPIENSAVHWSLWCYENEETCRNASPVSHLRSARTPTLIMQGEADLRVPKAQSDQLYAALRWKAVPVEYVVFPRAKHGFTEREHQIEACRRLLGWFEKYLDLRAPSAPHS
jgi:dipeptidyl aminopeptidase/acylaminoacyl peptidase